MDALSALRTELSKKRKQESVPLSEAGAGERVAKRWKSHSAIEAEREREYRSQDKEARKRRENEKQRKWRESRVDVKSTVETARGRGASDETASGQEEDNRKAKCTQTLQLSCGTSPGQDPPLSVGEVAKRLRSLKEPVTLFGEDPWDRFNRMRDLELAREEVSKGQRNVFQKKMREMEAKDAEDEMYKYTGAKLPHLEKHPSSEKQSNEYKEYDIGTATSKEDYVYGQLRKHMRLWASEIEDMPREERRTNKGRSLVVTYEQTKDWLKPLYKLLRKKKLARNILESLKSIFEAASAREYVRADSLYLERLAIGNAPWPMGATMVGIHARAAREKIGEDKISHLMNDERTRKYIQAVKRLLTVAQRHFPTPPSKQMS